MKCEVCDKECNRRSNVQKYCSSCSDSVKKLKNCESAKKQRIRLGKEAIKKYQLRWYKNNVNRVKKYNRATRLEGKSIYQSIKQRCSNPKEQNFKWYGGKGIQCRLSQTEFLTIYWRTDSCEICDTKMQDQNRNLSNGRTVDRIDSLGHYDVNNLMIICKSCNVKKDHRSLKR